MTGARRTFRLLLVCAAAGLPAAVSAGCGTDPVAGDDPPRFEERLSGPGARAKARAESITARRQAAREARMARSARRQAAREERARARRAKRQAHSVVHRASRHARALARRGGDVNCGDFASQAQAQLYLLAGDPFNLDGNDDGIACNSLPCPCAPAAGGSGEGGMAPPRAFAATVVSVVDGDTVKVTTPAGPTETVRLIGIDTPEVHGGEECGGAIASAAMKRLAGGQRVRVIADPTQDRRDRYGRLLAYIDRGSRDLGLALVRRGLASAYPYDGRFQRYGPYTRAEREARRVGRGSWRHCDISPG